MELEEIVREAHAEIGKLCQNDFRSHRAIETFERVWNMIDNWVDSHPASTSAKEAKQ